MRHEPLIIESFDRFCLNYPQVCECYNISSLHEFEQVLYVASDVFIEADTELFSANLLIVIADGASLQVHGAVAVKNHIHHQGIIGQNAVLNYVANTFYSYNLTLKFVLAGSGAYVSALVRGTLQKSSGLLSIDQEHSADQTESYIEVRPVLYDGASVETSGSIHMPAGSKNSQADQQIKGLLLGDDIYFAGRPALIVGGNTASCEHGAAAGPLDEQQRWYLCSRGLLEKQAENILIQSFLKEL